MDYCNCGENKGCCIDCAEEQLAAATKELSDVRAAAKAEVKRLFGDGETLRAALTTAKEENERLTAENATLRAAVAGKTFSHSDEEVNAEMGRLRAKVERYAKALKDIALESSCSSGDLYRIHDISSDMIEEAQ